MEGEEGDVYIAVEALSGVREWWRWRMIYTLPFGHA